MDFRKSSGGLPKNGKPKDSFGRASEERKPKDSQSDGLPYSEERENSKIRSGGLLKKEKPRNQDSIWWASEERKTKKPRNVRSGGLPKNENLKIRSGGLPKNENPKIHSGRLLKNENPKIKIRSGGLLCGKTKIRKIGWSGLLTFGKRRTKIRLGCLRCLLKNRKNQRFVSSGGLLKNNQRFVYTNT
ncbi:unnamed protein product [Rhizophagus irregularis]|uniref:Uncharacterized protein n=1 Tax=Rhizophagus irregularis TaxID=588596 RepID=A0A916EIJ9_9GLOM|nr:unnamed protein product [Rhizophagus irregularis]